jgi:hypothetical protein
MMRAVEEINIRQSFLRYNEEEYRRNPHHPRAKFALLIKILLKRLEQSGDLFLYQQVKIVISTCTQRNRMKDPHFAPLEDILQVHLRDMVGEAHWQAAKDLPRVFLLARRRRREHANTRTKS